MTYPQYDLPVIEILLATPVALQTGCSFDYACRAVMQSRHLVAGEIVSRTLLFGVIADAVEWVHAHPEFPPIERQARLV